MCCTKIEYPEFVPFYFNVPSHNLHFHLPPLLSGGMKKNSFIRAGSPFAGFSDAMIPSNGSNCEPSSGWFVLEAEALRLEGSGRFPHSIVNKSNA